MGFRVIEVGAGVPPIPPNWGLSPQLLAIWLYLPTYISTPNLSTIGRTVPEILAFKQKNPHFFAPHFTRELCTRFWFLYGILQTSSSTTKYLKIKEIYFAGFEKWGKKWKPWGGPAPPNFGVTTWSFRQSIGVDEHYSWAKVEGYRCDGSRENRGERFHFDLEYLEKRVKVKVKVKRKW